MKECFNVCKGIHLISRKLKKKTVFIPWVLSIAYIPSICRVHRLRKKIVTEFEQIQIRKCCSFLRKKPYQAQYRCSNSYHKFNYWTDPSSIYQSIYSIFSLPVIDPSKYLSLQPSSYRSIKVFVTPAFQLSIHQSMCQSILSSTNPSKYVSIHPFIYRSI